MSASRERGGMGRKDVEVRSRQPKKCPLRTRDSDNQGTEVTSSTLTTIQRSTVTPVVFQPADMGKWVAAVEAVTNATPTYTSNERVKVFNSVDGTVMAVCPAHSAKLTCVGTSGFTVKTVIKSPPIPIWRAVQTQRGDSTFLNGIVIRSVWATGRSGRDT